MFTAEVVGILKANIDKTVKITYRSGETDVAQVISVDDEGFVYDLNSSFPDDQKTFVWTALSEIAGISFDQPALK
jgi:hypothetical protein